jgi:hypothetical protein
MPEKNTSISSIPPFNGARKEGKPFKNAVEDYLLRHYREMIVDGRLTMAHLRSNPSIAIAVKSYKDRFGYAPFNIRSNREIAAERLVRVLEVGYKEADRDDRDAANRIIRRIAKNTGSNDGKNDR